MLPVILAIPVAIGVGAITSILISFRRGEWAKRFLIAASLIYVSYYVVLLGLPFWNVASEALVVLVAGAALVLPMTIFMRRTAGQKVQHLRQVLPFVLGFFLFVPVLFTLVSRVTYARRVHWACDGQIVERTRTARNHNAPTLVVQNGDRQVRFEMVDEAFWQVAQPQQRLVKAFGSTTAMLDGQRLRIVPRDLPWRNDPP